MSIFVGGTRVQDIYVGDTPVSAVYVGADKVWSKTAIFFNFNQVVKPDLTSLGFVHSGPGTTYKIISDGRVARINLPDGFGTIGEHIDRVRYATATSPSDNGYLRFKLGSLGADPSPSVANYFTDIFVRGSNGGVTHGVGIRAELGTIKILSRIAGTEVVRADCGSFDPDKDDFLLRFTGNVWTLYRNGDLAGEWNDSTGLAASGAGYRSLIWRQTGGVELFGPRQYSPDIDYIEYG